MVRRLVLSLFVAATLAGFNIPMPAFGSTSPPPAGRVLINAPEMPAVDMTPPALPAGAAVKHPAPVGNSHSGAAVRAGQLNHVNALSSATVAKLHQQGLKVLDNRQGLWRIEANVNGQDRVLTVVDGVLPSGREVTGFGTAPASAPAATSLIRALNVSAATSYFFICSYAYMSSYWDDLHLHLCAIDAAYILAILTVVEAAVGTVVGLLMGGVVGAAVGLAIGTLLAIATIGYFWAHSDSQGNVNIVIPHQTILPPFGGNVLWADSGRWDYMWDQCWVYEDQWYAPVCSY